MNDIDKSRPQLREAGAYDERMLRSLDDSLSTSESGNSETWARLAAVSGWTRMSSQVDHDAASTARDAQRHAVVRLSAWLELTCEHAHVTRPAKALLA